MGAECGVDHCYEPDVEKAFAHLRDEAYYDHGHAGYTGSIAEAGGYSVYDTKLRLLPDAEEFAWHLANEVAEKWEAALAIPFVSLQRQVEILVPQYDHPKEYAKVQETLIEVALTEARRQRLLRRGEKITKAPEILAYSTPRGVQGTYSNRLGYERRTHVKMRVHIDRAKSALTPEALARPGQRPDGWVFAGCYSC